MSTGMPTVAPSGRIQLPDAGPAHYRRVTVASCKLAYVAIDGRGTRPLSRRLHRSDGVRTHRAILETAARVVSVDGIGGFMGRLAEAL
jgi:hypothetical protein